METSLFKKRLKTEKLDQAAQMQKEIRAGFYIRVSTEEQAGTAAPHSRHRIG
jgi:hypothetical protein